MKLKKVISLFITGALLLSVSAGTTTTASAIDYNDTLTTNSISDVATEHLAVESGASTQEKEFTYTKTSSETVVIDGYLGNESNIIIPSYIDGYKVTSLSSWAFETNENLKSLIIPSTVSDIRDILHLKTYEKLESITVEAGNENYASAGGALLNKDKTELLLCPAGYTASYTVPNSVTTICYRAFDDCKKLTKVSIPGSVTTIETSAFSDCITLNTVNFSEGLTTIKNLAFYNCPKLKDITIPDSVTYIGDNAFGIYTYENQEYLVEDLTFRGYKGSYAYFYTFDAVKAGLVNFIDLGKSQYYLEFYYYLNEDNTISIYHYLGDNKNVLVPSTIDGYNVTRIEGGAFFDNDNITSVIVPNSVSIIGHSAFSECDNLESVFLPESLKTIGDDYDPIEYNVYAAFEQCPKLKSITIPASVTNMTYSGLGYYVDGSKINNFTIRGYQNTAGQTYAVDNGFKFVALDYNTLPESIQLNKTSIALGVGEAYNLKATITPSNATTEYIWLSDNTNVATVSSSGRIIANKSGTATITVITSNGKVATCTVTVKNAPSKITLNKTSLTLGVGETFDLNSSLPSGTASYSIKYSSNNANIASVASSGGLVTANKAGTAVITATTYNGKRVSCTVTVKNSPDKVSLNTTGVTLGVGETFDLNSRLPNGTASYSIVYSSNNANVASVASSGGLVTAKSAGTAIITATTYNGKTATCTITVKNAPSSISLNIRTLPLGIGESFNINGTLPRDTASYNIKYTSSNPNVASVVASNGVVTGKTAGTATITATTHNGKTATCTILVKNVPNSISLNKSNLTLGVGETFDLNHTLPSDTASFNVKYSSNNSSVASVSFANGLITAKKAGTAIITAKTHNGKTTTCTVTVKEAPNEISLNKTDITLGVGEKFTLSHVLPTNTASYSVRYLSSDNSIANVPLTNGIVTAKKAGTATITVRTFNGKTATCNVTVKNAPNEISLNQTSITLNAGETFELISVLPSNTASYRIKYSSSDTSVATVNTSDGLVTANATGTATITAKTFNGKTATCEVIVR